MVLFEIYICILGTIFVIDKVIDTLLNIVALSDSLKNETPEPNHINSMYS